MFGLWRTMLIIVRFLTFLPIQNLANTPLIFQLVTAMQRFPKHDFWIFSSLYRFYKAFKLGHNRSSWTENVPHPLKSNWSPPKNFFKICEKSVAIFFRLWDNIIVSEGNTSQTQQNYFLKSVDKHQTEMILYKSSQYETPLEWSHSL